MKYPTTDAFVDSWGRVYEGNEYHFPALPKEVLSILKDGGLIAHVRKQLGKQ